MVAASNLLVSHLLSSLVILSLGVLVGLVVPANNWVIFQQKKKIFSTKKTENYKKNLNFKNYLCWFFTCWRHCRRRELHTQRRGHHIQWRGHHIHSQQRLQKKIILLAKIVKKKIFFWGGQLKIFWKVLKKITRLSDAKEVNSEEGKDTEEDGLGDQVDGVAGTSEVQSALSLLGHVLGL